MPYDRTAVPDSTTTLEWSERYQMYIRPQTTDFSILAEMPAYGPIGLLQGETVLDLGANIGGYVREALKNGAGRIIAFEPDHENFQILKRNTEMLHPDDVKKVKLYEAAVIGSQHPSLAAAREVSPDTNEADIVFYKNTRKCKASHSTVRFRGRQEVIVKAYDAAEIIRHFKPDRIKVDIEYEEINIFQTIHLSSYVKGVLIEYHLNKPGARKSLWVTHQNFLSQGFVCDDRLAPKDTGSNWHCLICYRRN